MPAHSYKHTIIKNAAYRMLAAVTLLKAEFKFADSYLLKSICLELT